MIIKAKVMVTLDIEIRVDDRRYVGIDEYYGYDIINEDQLYDEIEEAAKQRISGDYEEMEIDDNYEFEVDEDWLHDTE